MRPIAIPPYIKECIQPGQSAEERIRSVREAYTVSSRENPVVSIVIPAYNEAGNILQTLLSLSRNRTRYVFEIIVVNNNSQDDTERLVRASGVRCVNEVSRGITAARTAGLMAARGKYVMNADADTIYPEGWVQLMIEPLETKGVALTYGRFSFIPLSDAGRWGHVIYEYVSDISRLLKRYLRDEAVNVFGFNSAFRREEGIKVDGYQHPPGGNEDGNLALKLRDNGFGRLRCITDTRALVWTSDRRVQSEGGLWKGSLIRLKRFFSRNKMVTVRPDL
jgi:glycosyltransferase involved in cell wall biosynthesis